MRDELLAYYERELTYVRQLGAEFAAKYPKIASRLALEPTRCEDPHVERLIEAFAFLAARIHLKVDDEFSEVTSALLGILYPHYLRPIPSMTVAEFHLDPKQGGMTSGLKVPRGANLLAKPVNGYRCSFRTCSDVTVWPIDIVEAQWTTPDRVNPPVKAPDCNAALRLILKTRQGATFSKLGLNKLRFFLNGEASLIFPLYEMLGNNTKRVLLREVTNSPRRHSFTLPAGSLQPSGFDPEDAVLPYPQRSFDGYRLLQEYFSFPEKYLFYELSGLDVLEGSEIGDQLEVLFLLSPTERTDWETILQMGVTTKTIRLNCAPAVNLFPHTADPILVENTRFEYPVIPDVRRTEMLEVFSMEEVVATNPRTMEVVRFEPFYSFRHMTAESKNQLFWYATRRPSKQLQDDSTELHVTLVDLEGRGRAPDYDALTVRCLCTNREVPSRLSMGSDAGDFDMDGAGPIQKIIALRKPSPTIRPPLGTAAFWRLISHLSLNYLSLVEEGHEALQEILRLYTPGSAGIMDRQVEGIARVRSSRQLARVADDAGIAFVRGTRVELTLDEEYFVGSGAFLFANVIDRFLGLYVGLNSFTQLEARTKQRKGVLRRWPARAGRAILL